MQLGGSQQGRILGRWSAYSSNTCRAIRTGTRRDNEHAELVP